MNGIGESRRERLLREAWRWVVFGVWLLMGIGLVAVAMSVAP